MMPRESALFSRGCKLISLRVVPCQATATLKFVLREIPTSREHDGLVYLALHNVPKGVPARVHLDDASRLVACTSKLWRTALQRTQALAASGPPLWIVEAHVGVQEGALLAVVKGIQVLARVIASNFTSGIKSMDCHTWSILDLFSN